MRERERDREGERHRERERKREREGERQRGRETVGERERERPVEVNAHRCNGLCKGLSVMGRFPKRLPVSPRGNRMNHSVK